LSREPSHLHELLQWCCAVKEAALLGAGLTLQKEDE
jgi:hypothetical protein